MSEAEGEQLYTMEELALAAEARMNDALAKRHRAEARKARAEAREAELDVIAKRLVVKDLRRDERREAASDDRHHVYQFTDPVTATSVKSCLRALGTWHRLHPNCDIEIVFNSPGGSVIDGFALWDYLTELKASHHITTVCRGMAASMAGILLQAGHKRVMGAESVLLVHEISFGAGGKIGEVEDEVAFAKMLTKRVLKIFADRTNLTERQIENKWRRTDWWLDSDEALKLGFCDEVR